MDYLLVRNCHANIKSRSFCCDYRRPHSKDSALAKYAELAQSGQSEVVARHIFHSRSQGTICTENWLELELTSEAFS